MKKILSAVIILGICMSFAGCNTANGVKEDINSGISDVESIASDIGSDMTDKDKTDTTESDKADLEDSDASALRDGTYKESGNNYDSKGYKPTVELTVTDGKISKIECDGVNKDGEYRRDNKNQSEWEDKMELFEKEVVLKGLDNIAIADDGSVTGIDGMDLNVGEYRDLLEKAIDKAKK